MSGRSSSISMPRSRIMGSRSLISGLRSRIMGPRSLISGPRSLAARALAGPAVARTGALAPLAGALRTGACGLAPLAGALRTSAVLGPLACALAVLACSPAPPAATPDGPGPAAPAAPPPAPAAPPASAAAAAPELPPVTLEPVERTRIEGKPPVLGVVAPAKNQVIPAAKAAAFEVRVSAKGWEPAAGDHLCVVLDKRPCRRVADPAQPVPLGELGPLDEGQHVLSVLARRATGEILRAGKSSPFASASFFVGKRGPVVYKEGAPMLIYSAPEKGPAPGEGVLIDFFLAHAEVRSGSYAVAATVGGPGIERGVGLLIEADRPVRIRNARPGEYLSRLTLMEYVPDLGESNSRTAVIYTSKPASGPFAEVERSIFVTR